MIDRIFKINTFLAVLVGYTCNPRTEKAEAGESLQVLGQPELHSEFKTSLNYAARACLEREKIPKINKFIYLSEIVNGVYNPFIHIIRMSSIYIYISVLFLFSIKLKDQKRKTSCEVKKMMN